MQSLSTATLLRYGVLAIPLAFAGLPIYVHLPKLYADNYGADLALLGLVLLAIRLIDTVQDPLIGWLSDRYAQHRHVTMRISALVLGASYLALFLSPYRGGWEVLAWLAVSLTLVYTSFSVLMISYYAQGVALAGGYHDNTRVAAFREGFLLVGVIVASILPHLLMQSMPAVEAYQRYSVIYLGLLLLCALPSLSLRAGERAAATINISLRELWQMRELRWLFALFFFNSLPVAITSTLFLFFVDDVLGAEAESGLLLAGYFLAGVAAMPLWVKVSRYLGKRRSLSIGMVLAIASFIWAYGLGQGDIAAFWVIVALSGIALGADMALLPSLLADVLARKQEASATGFGIWNLLSKLNMALAAGITLPLLAMAGYQSGAEQGEQALGALSFAYALLPCACKALALLLLLISPIDERKQA